MFKFGKVILSASLLFTGVSAIEGLQPENVAEAAITPYYTYNGYAGYNAKFVNEKAFINAFRLKTNSQF